MEGEHGSKGGLGSKGAVKDVRHEEDERVRVAPNSTEKDSTARRRKRC